ncbi:MAG: hypothetical protein EOP83_26075 [Verrucomicrobiaceae bacterium]|nr:MAG: hypothetical protein EOP83_26075 [Verrucomicrobiaceae bacterium]
MRSFLIYSSNFGSDFIPFPPFHIRTKPHCLIEELRGSFSYILNDFGENRFLNFLEAREYLHHWEFLRLYTVPRANRWKTKHQINDFIVIHVYSDDEAFEARLHTDAQPLPEGWRERFERNGVGDDDWVN